MNLCESRKHLEWESIDMHTPVLPIRELLQKILKNIKEEIYYIPHAITMWQEASISGPV
jgi:hypothetical protein